MMRKIAVLGVVGLMGLSIGLLQTSNAGDESGVYEQPPYIETMKFASSRYSQPDDVSAVDPELFLDIENDDVLIAENDRLRLYFNEDILSFKIENKSTGYVFATHIDNADAGSYEGLLSGGLGIEYIAVDKKMNTRSNVGITDTVYTADIDEIEDGVRIDLDIDGYCATRNCKRLYPLYLQGRYTLEQMIDIGFAELELGFDVIVKLEEDGIHVTVPVDSVEEQNPEKIMLSSIIIFPGLGATRMDEIPGYMMVPDGAGALVRYEDNEGKYLTPYEAPFYGRDPGLQPSSANVMSHPLSMPIFGMVHGVGQNGLLGVVESGVFSSSLFMYFNGAHNLDYNLLFPKFYYRKTYRQSFTSDGTGGAMRNVRTLGADIDVAYKVLDGDDASYVGMANTYRDLLTERHVFDAMDTTGMPIHLAYLMSDSESSFFGTNTVTMSTFDDVTSMQSYFTDQGVLRTTVSLLGWNEGGYSGYLPSDMDLGRDLGSNRAYSRMMNALMETGSVHLVNDFVVAGSGSSMFSSGRDIARGIDRFQIRFECHDCVHEDSYLIRPNSTRQYADKTFPDYETSGPGVLFQNLGHMSFSHHQDENHMRRESFETYQQIMASIGFDAAFDYPFAYAFPYADHFTDTPLYNSQMTYFDDLVPVLQTVLHGLLPMYSDYLNFNSLGREQLLTLIDFGVYPSFILTQEPSSELKDTDVESFFTTEFDLWKDTVIEEYAFIRGGLEAVIGQRRTSRRVLDPGFVKNEYANGVTVYVNYSSTVQTDDGILVDAHDYLVVGDDV